MLRKGHPLSVTMIHAHKFGTEHIAAVGKAGVEAAASKGGCRGQLVVQRGTLSFKPESGNHGFAVIAEQVMDVRNNSVDRAQPMIELRLRDDKNKEKAIAFYSPIFFMAKKKVGRDLFSKFLVVEQPATTDFNYMLMRLITSYVGIPGLKKR
jgi:hypothetical protein